MTEARYPLRVAHRKAYSDVHDAAGDLVRREHYHPSFIYDPDQRRALQRLIDRQVAAENARAGFGATEPTAAGLQYVMPGCERDRDRGPVQGDLF